MKHNGRPRNIPDLNRNSFLAKGEKSRFDITFFLDKVMSWLHSISVPDFFDVIESIKGRLVHECNRLNEIRKEMQPLEAAHNLYVDLYNERIKRENRIQRIVAVLGKQGDSLLKQDQEPDYPISAGMTIAARSQREDLPLWEAMREYLHYVPEARISEMESFFGTVFGVDFPSNRQAMESALKRHPNVFKVRKVKREKLISLREKARD